MEEILDLKNWQFVLRLVILREVVLMWLDNISQLVEFLKWQDGCLVLHLSLCVVMPLKISL